MQHSDDEEKQKVIDSIMKVSRDNGFDDAYLQQHSDCSASSIKRFHSAWMGKRMSNWTTIFNLAHCVSVYCVFAENLVGMLVVIIMFLIRDAGIVSYHIDSPKKVVIEINFGKDKLLRMKDEEKNEKGKEGKRELAFYAAFAGAKTSAFFRRACIARTMQLSVKLMIK